MPIYEYQCQSCGHEFEALQKLSDAILTECPACADAALKKKISAVAFRLKGGGWYETDFKSGDKRNLAGDAGKTAGGDASRTSGEGQSSKEAKAETKSKETKAGENKTGENKTGSKRTDTVKPASNG